MPFSPRPAHYKGRLLRWQVAVAIVFFLGLALATASLIMEMYGIAFNIRSLVLASPYLSTLGVLLLAGSIAVLGGFGLIGILMQGIGLVAESRHKENKRKNCSGNLDLGISRSQVNEFLSALSAREKTALRGKLARARLAIREDGTLIPIEQAEHSPKLDRIIEL